MGKRFEWVELGTDVMREARKRKGLSYEGAARQINSSAKTYERYEKSGKVPAQMVESVARTLGLEVEASAPVRVFTEEAEAADAARLVLEVAEVNDRLRRIEEHLGIAPDGPSVRASGRAANGHD